jgi:hypothetical protein
VDHLTDLFDAQLLEGQDFRTGDDPGLFDPGQLEVIGQQPIGQVPPSRLIRAAYARAASSVTPYPSRRRPPAP